MRPTRGAQEHRRWDRLVANHHYLSFQGLFGQALRHVATLGATWIALLGWQAAALKLTARDRWIGWSPRQKLRRLHLVTQNSRFLILPWIRLPCLASHLLACLERQLPHEWQQRYRIRPVLLETFCETPRFAGTCYRAANWIRLGQTEGRGKLDTRHEYAKPVKNTFVKPLCPDWKAILNR